MRTRRNAKTHISRVTPGSKDEFQYCYFKGHRLHLHHSHHRHHHYNHHRHYHYNHHRHHHQQHNIVIIVISINRHQHHCNHHYHHNPSLSISTLIVIIISIIIDIVSHISTNVEALLLVSVMLIMSGNRPARARSSATLQVNTSLNNISSSV